MILKIETGADNPILRAMSEEVTNISEHLDFIKDMHETLDEVGGVGLAAPQVGKNIRIFIVHFKDLRFTVINPVILDTGLEELSMDEQCLSLPDITCKVKRHIKLTTSFLDEAGDIQRKKFKWRLARIFKHEYDHLVGKLIVDY